MKSSNQHCLFCKITLSEDQNDLGYCPNLHKYNDANKQALICKRCFDLINYNKLNNNKLSLQTINEQLDNLFKLNATFYLVCDVFNLLSNDLINYLKKLNKSFQFNIIVNKMDLINNVNLNNYENFVLNYLNQFDLMVDQIFFISAKINTSLNHLYNDLNKHDLNVFFGYSNVGKSSLIQQLLKLENVQNEHILINQQLNTTLINQIYSFEKFKLYDSPGFIDNQNLLNFINLKDQKTIFVNNLKNVKTFQIKYNKTLHIENLIYLDVFVTNKQVGSLNFYMNHLLKIKSFDHLHLNHFNQNNYINYASKAKINKLTINPDYSNNKSIIIAIDGLGLIKLNKISKIVIYYMHDLKIQILS